MFCNRFILILILLFAAVFMTSVAAGEDVQIYSDSYSNISVSSGDNTISLGVTYDSNYVTDISGYIISSSYTYYRIETQYEIGLPHTYAVEIDKEYGMLDDYSNVWFEYKNGTTIPIFKYEKFNSSKAVFFVFIENTQQTQDIYVKYSSDATPNQTDARVFLNYIKSGNATMVGSNYTSLTGRNSSSLYPISTNNMSNISFILSYQRQGWRQTDVSNGGLYSPNSTRVVNYNGYNFSISGTTLRGVNGTYFYIMHLDKIGGGVFSRFQTNYNANVVESNEFRMSTSLRWYAPDVSPVYNRTAYTFKTTEAIITKHTSSILPSPVTIDIPSGNFSSILFNSDHPGNLSFNVSYSPHVVPLTPNGSAFQENVQLFFDQHPSTFSTEYQIAVDPDFFGIVTSSLTESGSSSVSVTLPPGTYYWHMRQNDGSYTDTRSFTVSEMPATPGNFTFKIFNESNVLQAVSANIALTNATAFLAKSGSTVTFNSSQVVAGQYVAKVSATNFTTRYYVVESPGNYSFYLANNSASIAKAPVLIRFSLIDNTNDFPYAQTQLVILKQTANGTIIIQNNYFDAGGNNDAELIPGENYILKLVSNSGNERIVGNIVPAVPQSTRLVVGDIDIHQYPNVFGGFGYNLSMSPADVTLQWDNNMSALVGDLRFKVTPQNNTSNQPFEIKSDGPFGKVTYTIPDQNDTYLIEFYAQTTNGTINHKEYYSPTKNLLDFGLSDLTENAICVLILVVIAVMFGAYHAKSGILIVAAIAMLMWIFGILHVASVLIIWVAVFALLVRLGNEYVRG